MTRFMVAYIFLIIGFMMSFIIYFADQDPFKSFPGFFVKVFLQHLEKILNPVFPDSGDDDGGD